MFPKKGNKLHQPGRENATGLNFSKTVAAALRAELGRTHRAANTIMYWTGASERTVKN